MENRRKKFYPSTALAWEFYFAGRTCCCFTLFRFYFLTFSVDLPPLHRCVPKEGIIGSGPGCHFPQQNKLSTIWYSCSHRRCLATALLSSSEWQISGNKIPNGTNVCFHSFLWSSPSPCLPFCLRPGGRGGRKQNGRQVEGCPFFSCTAAGGLAVYSTNRSLFGHGPLLKTNLGKVRKQQKCPCVMGNWPFFRHMFSFVESLWLGLLRLHSDWGGTWS